MQITAAIARSQRQIEELALEDLALGQLPAGAGRAFAPLVWLALWRLAERGSTCREVWCSNSWIAAAIGFDPSRRGGKGIAHVREALRLLVRAGRIMMRMALPPRGEQSKPVRVITLIARADRVNPRRSISLPGGDPVAMGRSYRPNATVARWRAQLAELDVGEPVAFRQPTTALATAYVLHVFASCGRAPSISLLASMVGTDRRWVGARLDRLVSSSIVVDRKSLVLAVVPSSTASPRPTPTAAPRSRWAQLERLIVRQKLEQLRTQVLVL